MQVDQQMYVILNAIDRIQYRVVVLYNTGDITVQLVT